MSLCLGIDLSTKRVDLAAIPLDHDETWGPDTWRLDANLRDIRHHIIDLLEAQEFVLRRDFVTVAIEKPAGKFVHPSLHELHGAIVASIPHRIQVTSLYPVEWRQALGLVGTAKNNKAAGLGRVLELYPMCASWDEHQLDALGIAHAWRTLQWNATEGAA